MQYVKKPIPVEAELFIEGMQDGFGENGGSPYIATLENKMHFGAFGDNYLVKGNHGDKWLVRKDIFEATYEKIHAPEVEVAVSN